jgi:hypothetical protein
VLPTLPDLKKVGLDDFLVSKTSEALEDLVQEVLNKRSAFPRHPNPKQYVNGKLQHRLSRKDAQAVSLAILSELDARGFRIRSKATQLPYFFDETDHRLMPAALLHRHGEPLHESPFGEFLYKNYGLTAGDSKILTWLASQFTGEDPVGVAEPRRVLTIAPENPDCIALQISDSQFVMVSPDPDNPIEVLSNGSQGILFEQDQVEPMEPGGLLQAYNRLSAKPLKPWWPQVLKTINTPKTKSEQTRLITALLYYISPWLNNWRGADMPVEMLVGEAGSGKSSLCELRLTILTGRPVLRNAPTDIRDWHASIANSGGLHVIDNIQFTNKDLRQRISDEVCRLVTEPDPHVEMRRLYTTASQARMPVNVAFAFTAIKQPFTNQDIMQRSSVFDLLALTGAKDGYWVEHQLEKHKGRTNWLAHHLLFLHRFLRGVVHDGLWDPEYEATHRLTHYEQCLIVAAEVLGLNSDWIVEGLAEATDKSLSEADWALEGLKVFAAQSINDKDKRSRFTCGDIASWAMSHEEYSDCHQLTNPRRLGRYIQSHQHTIQRLTGITEIGHTNNRKLFSTTKGLKGNF